MPKWNLISMLEENEMYEHPKFSQLMKVSIFLKELGMNGGQTTNRFIKNLYPKKEDDKSNKLERPSTKHVWLMNMDFRIIDAIQNPFCSPFHTPPLLTPLQIELNIFYLQSCEPFLSKMIYPKKKLD